MIQKMVRLLVVDTPEIRQQVQFQQWGKWKIHLKLILIESASALFQKVGFTELPLQAHVIPYPEAIVSVSDQSYASLAVSGLLLGTSNIRLCSNPNKKMY